MHAITVLVVGSISYTTQKQRAPPRCWAVGLDLIEQEIAAARPGSSWRAGAASPRRPARRSCCCGCLHGCWPGLRAAVIRQRGGRETPSITEAEETATRRCEWELSGEKTPHAARLRGASGSITGYVRARNVSSSTELLYVSVGINERKDLDFWERCNFDTPAANYGCGQNNRERGSVCTVTKVIVYFHVTDSSRTCNSGIAKPRNRIPCSLSSRDGS